MDFDPDPGTRHVAVGRRSTATHTSRREIDMAIGAYMTARRCPEHTARSALIRAARATGVGLGAISQALPVRVSGFDVGPTSKVALEFWGEHLHLPEPSARDDR